MYNCVYQRLIRPQLLTCAIAHTDSLRGYSTWRWIFIIEGADTCVISFGLYFLIADWPETAKFFSSAEKERIAFRLREEDGVFRMNRFDSESIKRIAFDWKIWIYVVVYFGVSLSTYIHYAVCYYDLGSDVLQRRGRASLLDSISVMLSALALGSAYSSNKLRHRFAFRFHDVVLSWITLVILLN